MAPTGRQRSHRRRWSRADSNPDAGDLPHHDQPLQTSPGAPLVRIPQLQLVRGCRQPPQLPWWLRPFARFHADDHFADPFSCPPHSSLRDRLDAFFAARGLAVPDGRITALLQARVLGYVFNPLSIFWCHDRDGQLRHVIAEVHNTYGGRHAYLLPPADLPVVTAKNFYVSPFHQLAGYYLIRAPRPDRELDVTVTLHRDRRQVCPEFTATLRGQRRPATTRQIAMMQIISPLAPMVVAARIRIQGIRLWLRRVPVVPR